MVDSVDEVLAFADTVVVGNGAAEFRSALQQRRDGQAVVDFVRISDATSGGDYDGICW
jgi:GDP-mannose 6-dehydrogenase